MFQRGVVPVLIDTVAKLLSCDHDDGVTLKFNADAESVPLDERVHPLHHDTSRAPQVVQVLRIRSGSRPGQIQQIFVVPILFVIQILAIYPRFRLQTRVKIIHNPDTGRRRQLARVVLAVDALRIHFVGMVQ